MTERLAAKRGENTRFFVFADTVAAKSYTRKDDCHGWMGIRFQTRPGAEPSQILLHVSLLDRETVLQQEAMGILGRQPDPRRALRGRRRWRWSSSCSTTSRPSGSRST